MCMHAVSAQNKDDRRNFILVEVYSNKDAPAEHKATAHYAAWAAAVKVRAACDGLTSLAARCPLTLQAPQPATARRT